MIRTRLDVVVAVREREEDTAKRDVAEAEALAKAATQKAALAKQTALKDHRVRADVSTWEVNELAHHRALADARKAERDAEASQKHVEQVRVKLTSAHQRAEAVRRAADGRRTEIIRELDKAETKELDDVASMLFCRKVT
jgi:flagellar biosynthesis chaperone FliJ